VTKTISDELRELKAEEEALEAKLEIETRRKRIAALKAKLEESNAGADDVEDLDDDFESERDRRMRDLEERVARAERPGIDPDMKGRLGEVDPMKAFQAIFGGGGGGQTDDLIRSIELGHTPINVLGPPEDPNWLAGRVARAKKSGGG
jgi:hypothetical protein